MGLNQENLGLGSPVFYIISPITVVSVSSSARRSNGVDILLSAVKTYSQHTIGVEFSSRIIKLGERTIKLQVRIVCTSRESIAHAPKHSSGILPARRGSGAYRAFSSSY